MESEKIILDIVVDVQKDFITGALANPAGTLPPSWKTRWPIPSLRSAA